jgi:hypothetical protein
LWGALPYEKDISMNMFSINNLISNLRGRVTAVIGVVIAAIALCACGAFMTFYLAPTQAMQAFQISKMPQMTAQTVNDVAAGTQLLITGYINGKIPTASLPDYIAYTQQEWDVTVTEDSNGNDNTPSGSWTNSQTIVPDLTLDMGGTPISILSNNDATLAGQLHEKIIDSTGSLQADYNGQSLRDGALRYQGFFNGDLTTVYGKKASVDGVIPEELFAGDRVAFEAYQKQLASSYLFMGIAFMICAPIFMVIGTFAAAFGRRKGIR